jgi:glycosyltransferase involved in cell wall biosynthesis
VIDSATMDARSRLPVSVVVPAYNATATLPRALASVFAQTRLPAEIIVVDDASQDRTWDVLQQVCAEHPEHTIRTLRLDRNGGVAGARNAGWALASRDYIAFLDADDAWHPRKLELQYRWMTDHPQIALCGHRCEIADSPEATVALPISDIPAGFFGLGSFLVANRISTPTVMLRRTLDERFAEGKRYSEDYLLWMQIVAAHGPAGFIDLPLALMFKARYGATGLSSDLWRSQLGEIDTLSRLRSGGGIGVVMWMGTVMWSWLKFVKRAFFLVLFGSSLRRDIRNEPS